MLMVLNTETNEKIFFNENNSSSFTTPLGRAKELLKRSPSKLAIYHENSSPRWMRGGSVEEFGKRWHFSGVKNFEGNVTSFAD